MSRKRKQDETPHTPDRSFAASQSSGGKRLKPSSAPSQTVAVAALSNNLTSAIRPPPHTTPHIYPLSQRNLRLLNAMNNGEEVLTPCPSRSATSSAPVTNTPSGQSKSRGFLDANGLMKRYRLFGLAEGNAALASHEDFKTMVQGIVTGDRLSGMKPESQKKFMKNRAKLITGNESTLVSKLMPILVRDSRTVNSPQGDLVRDWDHDNLDANDNREFIRGFVPIPDVRQDQVLAKLLEKSPGMKNPKPDITYGLAPEAFTEEELVANETYAPITGISPRILHPFLIFEWKSERGTMEEARYQARRGGAALVNARRQLNVLANRSDSNGPDWNSFVFSCVLDPNVAYIHVHWCEQKNDQLSWYMSKVSGHLMDEEDGIKNLRRNIDNILDWGVLNRVQEIKGVLQKIYAQEEPGSSDVPTVSPNKRKRKSLRVEDAARLLQ